MSKRKPRPASEIILELKRRLKQEETWKNEYSEERDRHERIANAYRSRSKEILQAFGQFGPNLSREWIAGKLAEMLK